MDGRNRSAIHKNHQRVAKRAEVLRGLIARLNPSDLDAKVVGQRHQASSFQDGPVHPTPHEDSRLVLQRLNADLSLLESVCRLPLPERTDLTPTKAGAAKARRTLKMKQLKREAKKYFVAPLHEVLAAITDVSLDLDGETSADDVRKA